MGHLVLSIRLSELARSRCPKNRYKVIQFVGAGEGNLAYTGAMKKKVENNTAFRVAQPGQKARGGFTSVNLVVIPNDAASPIFELSPGDTIRLRGRMLDYDGKGMSQLFEAEKVIQ